MPETIDAPPVTTPVPETAPVPPPSPSPTTKAWTDILDSLPDVDDPPEPAKAEPKQPDAPKPEKPEPKESPKAEAPKPAEQKPAAPEPKDDLPTFRTNQELRKWAKERHAAATAAESKRTELENKLKQLETVVPKTQQGAEDLAQELTRARQRLQQQEQLIEIQAFEHSEKYQKEYAEPYWKARTKAEKEVSELMVNEPTGEVGEDEQPKFRQRPATKADFDKIYHAPRAQAREMAKAMFGEDAADVLSWRKSVSELAEKATEALNERRQNYAKYKQEEQTTQSQQQIAIQKLWAEANQQISQDPKRAEYWGEDKDDPEANAALAKGFNLADEFFSEKRDQMKPDERVQFDAYIRHTIAMGARLAYDKKKLKAENAQLKEEITQLRGSAPGTPEPVSPEPAPKKTTSTLDAIDEL